MLRPLYAGTHRMGGCLGLSTGLDSVEKKYLAPSENQTLAVKPVVRRYIDLAIAALN